MNDDTDNRPLHFRLSELEPGAIIASFPGLLRDELEAHGMTLADAQHAEAAVAVVMARVGIVQAQPLRRRPSTDATRARQSRGRRARLAQERQGQQPDEHTLKMPQAISDEQDATGERLAA